MPIKRGEIGKKLHQARITLAVSRKEYYNTRETKNDHKKTGRQKSLPFSSICSSSLPSALVVALLLEFAANEPILATSQMTSDGMQIMFVHFNFTNAYAM